MNQNVGAVLAEVAEKVNGSNTLVKQRVVDALAEKEIASRADLLDKCLAKLVEFDKSLKKLGPDQVAIAADGTKSESYSKARWEEAKKTKEKMGALEKATEAALSGQKEQWVKLREALQKAGNAGGGDKGKPEESSEAAE